MKILYIKHNERIPSKEGFVVQALPNDHELTTREEATSGHPVLFGSFLLDITEDEVVLCNNGRRKVDDKDNPTAILPVN